MHPIRVDRVAAHDVRCAEFGVREHSHRLGQNLKVVLLSPFKLPIVADLRKLRFVAVAKIPDRDNEIGALEVPREP